MKENCITILHSIVPLPVNIVIVYHQFPAILTFSVSGKFYETYKLFEKESVMCKNNSCNFVHDLLAKIKTCLLVIETEIFETNRNFFGTEILWEKTWQKILRMRKSLKFPINIIHFCLLNSTVSIYKL